MRVLCLRIAMCCFTTIFALSHADAGVLYGVVGDGGGNGLVRIDVSDASTTTLAPLGNGNDGEGIAYNPNDGLLYHTSGISNGSEFFETIDPLGGFSVGANLVPGNTYGPDSFQEISAVEWYDPLGVFVGMDRDGDWFHATTAGVFTDVGDYDGAGGFGYMRGLAVVGTRVFSISPDQEDLIEELDPTNGQVLSSINFTVNGNAGNGGTGLAYDSDTGSLYGVVRAPGGRHLATLDLNTGNFTTIGVLPSGIAGLTVVPNAPVPEPSSFAIFGVGAIGLIGFRRRKRNSAA